MTNETLFSNIYSVTGSVVKKTDVTSILLSTIILIAGIVFFVVSFQFDANSDEWSMLCLLLGIAGVAYGIIRLCVKNKHTVYAPTGSPLKKTRIYFKSEDLGKVLKVIDGNFSDTTGLHDNENGTVRLDLLTSADGEFAAAQAFMYQDSSYAAQCAAKTFTGDAVKRVSDAIIAVKM